MGFGMFLDVLDVGCRLESLGMGGRMGHIGPQHPLTVYTIYVYSDLV